MTGIEAILFDLDDTLVRYERSPGEVLETSFDIVGSEPLFSVEDYYARYDEFAAKCDSMDELRAECFATLAAENGYDPECGRAVARTFSDERDQTNVELLPAVEPVLDELGRVYRLGIVTNGAPDAQHRKITAASLDQWIETVVIAGHEVPPKPDPEPFERAMRSLGATPETTVHVGDSPETDIAGATAAGLDSILIADGTSDVGEHTPTHRFESIAPLTDRPWADG